MRLKLDDSYLKVQIFVKKRLLALIFLNNLISILYLTTCFVKLLRDYLLMFVPTFRLGRFTNTKTKIHNNDLGSTYATSSKKIPIAF